MGLIYTRKKDESEEAIDFMKVVEAQQAAGRLTVGAVTAPLPYDVEQKRHIDRTIEQEQRPKDEDE